MRPRDRLHDDEPEAAPAHPVGSGSTVEALPNPRELVRVETRPIVGDADPGLVA